jgi:hypothetical protein
MTDEFDNNHGHSVAAWTGVGTILFGFLVGCIGLVVQSVWVVAVGVVICVIGIVAGKVLGMMGYGQSKVAPNRDGVG